MGASAKLHLERLMSLDDPFPGYEEKYGFPNEPRAFTKESFDALLVHGHTPEDPVTGLRWRIGVDSGVYKTAVLTAVRLYGEERRLLQVRAA